MNITFERDDFTDVAYATMKTPANHRRVQVIDVGDMVGFPGQVLARVDEESGELYGLTIENYSKFRRKLISRYRMASAKSALELMAQSLAAGLSVEHHSHDAVYSR
jgi:hypothetical protein